MAAPPQPAASNAMKPYSAIAVANFFIGRAAESRAPVTNLSLQKLVFFAHATAMNRRGEMLVYDPCTAWPYGPVFIPLYIALRGHGNNPVTEKAATAVLADDGSPVRVVPSVDDADTCAFLDQAWSALGHFPASKLVAASHQRGGAWYETVSKFVSNPDDMELVYKCLPRNVTILDSVIRRCGR